MATSHTPDGNLVVMEAEVQAISQLISTFRDAASRGLVERRNRHGHPVKSSRAGIAGHYLRIFTVTQSTYFEHGL
jgi:hypothetical protein